MFSDDEIREIPEENYVEPKDEIISVIEVCLDDKYDKRDLGFHGEPVLLNCCKNDLDVSRTIFEGLDQHRDGFPWVEDGNIADLVSETRYPGGQPEVTFDEDLDEELGNGDAKDGDISSSSSAAPSSVSRHGVTFARKQSAAQARMVTSSSNSMGPGGDRAKASSTSRGGKIDKADPRTRMHFVKYLKRQGRTVKLWECGICAREFQHQYTLMRHLPTHTDERNFHCEVCGKSFRQLSTLSQHRAIHSSQRPYSCEVCNKTFNRVSTLISHRKTHSEEKPYKCHLCPKGFHQKGNLRNHLFTHTNERPYRCDVCYKGFNQQSNLVCHKIKAHPAAAPGTSSSAQRIRRHYHPRSSRHAESVPDSTKPQAEYCEVTSSVGPYLPSVDYPTSSNWPKITTSKPVPDWSTDAYWASMTSNGVLVDPIKTFHMGVALATKQTPFALLKPDNGTPVLVKVIDMKLPSGKQMLVPATAEDLRDGGKIITNGSEAVQDTSAVQIRVPVVATVVPRVKPGGRLHLTVEEPHYAYHTALSAERTVSVEPCSLKAIPSAPITSTASDKRYGTPPPLQSCPGFERNDGAKPLLAWVLSQGPSPSPPLDLITLDLFDPVEGSQLPAVSNHATTHSDDSDIFNEKFEESIQLSDSD